MSLLYLVEQHNGIGLAAHGFGELTAFVVAYISRRGTDQTAHGMFLLILAHVDTGNHVLVVEEIFRESLGQLGLADTGGTQEDKRADWAAGVVEACTRAAHGIGDGADGLVLADHAIVQFLLEVEQLLFLALDHLVDRYASPAGNHVGYILGIDLLLDQSFLALHGFELFLNVGVFLLLLLYARIADFGNLGIVAFTLGTVSFEVELFNVDFVLLDAVDEILLCLPFGSEVFLLIAHFGQLLVDILHLGGVALALDGLALNLFLGNAP